MSPPTGQGPLVYRGNMNIEFHGQITRCDICNREMVKVVTAKKKRGISRAVQYVCEFCLKIANSVCVNLENLDET